MMELKSLTRVAVVEFIITVRNNCSLNKETGEFVIYNEDDTKVLSKFILTDENFSINAYAIRKAFLTNIDNLHAYEELRYGQCSCANNYDINFDNTSEQSDKAYELMDSIDVAIDKYNGYSDLALSNELRNAKSAVARRGLGINQGLSLGL